MSKCRLRKALLMSLLAIVLSNSENVYACEDMSDDVYENILDDYLKEQLDYYKRNPSAILEDVGKGEIVIDERGKVTKKDLITKIVDAENQFGDIGYIHVDSIGNSSSLGDGVPTRSFRDTLSNERLYKCVAVVGIKTGAEYPLALAEYNPETNKVGNIIGWYRDDDVYIGKYFYTEKIEMPIIKNITYGNIYDIDIDNPENDIYMLPNGYTKLTDNGRYGVRVDYTAEEIDGYYSWDGFYYSEDEIVERAKLDDNNLKLVRKFGIRNK